MRAFLDANLIIYLNTVREEGARRVYEDFFMDVLERYVLFTDALVLDEVLYISKKKYGVPYEVTMELLDDVVLPFVRILPIGDEEFKVMRVVIEKYGLKPSDALHIAVCRRNNIEIIISEDTDFDGIENVRRVWIGKTG
ncbi:MAG: type II toxin-antitoxin system VapC family toxin [Candidatus Baldrarchaeia archaeon]